MNTTIIPLCPEKGACASNPDRSAIVDLLYCLGITGKYVGFQYLAYALELTTREPEHLLLVTKWLYPKIAKHFGTSFVVVEQAMRSAVNVSWRLRKDMICNLTGYSAMKKPSTSLYLSLLTDYLLQDKAA